MVTWHCLKYCGACCHLDPADRPNLAEYLTPKEIEHYLSLVGEDGWCIHYNAERRQCNIYDQRPQFCRVEPENFERMYGINAEDFDEFAIECCQQQIQSVYGLDCRGYWP